MTHRWKNIDASISELLRVNDISFLGLDIWSKSHVKIKGHSRRGVCVLWMLLVVIVLAKM